MSMTYDLWCPCFPDNEDLYLINYLCFYIFGAFFSHNDNVEWLTSHCGNAPDGWIRNKNV